MVQFYKAPKKANKNNNKTHFAKAKREVVQIDNFDHSGNGLCLTSKPITVVEGALPNETCEIEIIKTTTKARFAKVSKLIEKNENRIEPFCEYYAQCGGCSLQHTNAHRGLVVKVNALRSYLAKFLTIDEHCWLPTIATFKQQAHEQDAYRRRVRLAIDARPIHSQQASAIIGYRAASSKAVINITHCDIAEPEINSLLSALRASVAEAPFVNMPFTTKIGHIVITKGHNFTQLALFVTANLPTNALKFLDKLATALSIQIVVVNKAKDDLVLGPIKAALQVKNSLVDELPVEQNADSTKDIILEVHPSHFIQVNATVNSQMLNLARKWILSFIDDQQCAPILFDFFCGSGNFSLSLADLFTQVNAYEGVDDMVRTAQKNAQLNNVNNCEFSTLDLANSESLKTLSIEKNAIVILDPSREGAVKLCEHLHKMKVAMIIYVSCNPNSFARDAQVLSRRYNVTKITALDMFPFTKHIELMAMLQPK